MNENALKVLRLMCGVGASVQGMAELTLAIAHEGPKDVETLEAQRDDLGDDFIQVGTMLKKIDI